MDAIDKKDCIHKLGGLLLAGGFVKESYVDAVLEREKHFPTGLAVEELSVAIPHTDIEHTTKPAIAVAILNSPVEFFEMATLNVVIYPEIIFLLSIVNPEDQVLWLQRLVTLFQKKGFLTKLKQSKDSEACYQYLFLELETLRNDEEEQHKNRNRKLSLV